MYHVLSRNGLGHHEGSVSPLPALGHHSSGSKTRACLASTTPCNSWDSALIKGKQQDLWVSVQKFRHGSRAVSADVRSGAIFWQAVRSEISTAGNTDSSQGPDLHFKPAFGTF